MYSSYYSLWKWPAGYFFYKWKINKIYGKAEMATDWENYIIFARDKDDNEVIYLNMILIYKWKQDWAIKLFNEKYWNYKELDKKYVEDVTLDEYKNFIKNNLMYFDDMFLLLNENISYNNIIQEKFVQTNTTISKEKPKYSKQLILSKNAIKKAKQEKYITQIDKMLISVKKEKLQQVFDKIQKLKKKNDIIKYLEAKIYLKLLEGENNTQELNTKNNEVFLVKEAQDFDKANNISRIYWDEKDNTLKVIDNKRNIVWWKQWKDSIYGWKLDDIIIVVWDMSKYKKTDTKQTLEFLWFKIQEINWKNFNISWSPKYINWWEWHDILFITWDIDLTETEIIWIEDIIIH